MRQVALSVEGMSCQHCVAAVRQALEGVDGVRVGTVMIGSAVIEIDEARATIGGVLDAVADAGYTADENAA